MITKKIESRPLEARRDVDAEPRDVSMTGHCHDAEKCNADTFCDCPCRTCMGTKRGDYQVRG